MSLKSYAVPISIKGIIFENNEVWLRKNERNEWELPGGKIDEGEQPEDTVVRELREELGFTVKPVKVIDAHMYKIQKSVDESLGVLVVSILCTLLSKDGDFELNGEAGLSEFKRFNLDELEALQMPEFYKRAILTARPMSQMQTVE